MDENNKGKGGDDKFVPPQINPCNVEDAAEGKQPVCCNGDGPRNIRAKDKRPRVYQPQGLPSVMTPQMENAQPAGVTSVLYLSETRPVWFSNPYCPLPTVTPASALVTMVAM